MMADHHRSARLSDGDLAEIARAMRAQTPDHAASLVIANALDAVVQRRLEAREARRRSNPARVGLVALHRLTCWASARASLRIDAALGRPLP